MASDFYDFSIGSNADFVSACYRLLLRRRPSAEDEDWLIRQLEKRKVSRSDVIVKFVNSEEFQRNQGAIEFVPPGHFYSALPSHSDREKGVQLYNRDVEGLADIDLNEEAQIETFHNLAAYYDECGFNDEISPDNLYYFKNDAYSYHDAISLYGMTRHFRPKKIVEIGSGFSSCALIDTNRKYFNSEIDISCIEPYPQLLDSLLGPNSDACKIIRSKVQEVETRIFSELESGDILVIDSTHVAKLQSDVNHIFFSVLPKLASGVVIHIHDIFWPLEYPVGWIEEGRAWNEIYMLRAFLQGNSNYEILYFSDYLTLKNRTLYEEHMPKCLLNTGGSFWMRKK